MKEVDHPVLRRKYQMELACKLTGIEKPRTIEMMMRRKGWTLAETIKYYLKMNGSKDN